MAWTMHKPTDCLLNQSYPEYQPPQPCEVQAATAQTQVTSPAHEHHTSARAAMVNFLDQLQAISEKP